jgi:hypothetical protein
MYHRPAPFASGVQALVFDRVSEAAARLLDKSPLPHASRGFTLKRLRHLLSSRP